MAANSRISILKKEGSESSAQQMDRVHAWYQPVVNSIIFICVDDNNYKAIETLISTKGRLPTLVYLMNSYIILAALAEASPPWLNNFFRSL